MDIKPVETVNGVKATCYSQNAWRRVVAVLHRKRRTDVVVEVATMTQSTGKMTNIPLCEIITAATVRFSSSGILNDNSIEAKAVSYGAVMNLSWDIIAYRQPKSGKTYKNLPECLVIGELPGTALRAYYTRSQLYRAYSRDLVDEFFTPIYSVIHNLVVLGVWRPQVIRNCTSTLRSPVLSNVSFGSTAASESHHKSPQSQRSMAKTEQTAKTDMSRQSSLILLPTEILLRIIEYVLSDEGMHANTEHFVGPYQREPPIAVQHLPMEFLSKTFRSVLRMVCCMREVRVHYRGRYRWNACLTTTIIQSAYYAASLILRFDSFPENISLPILRQINAVLRELPLLTTFRIEVAPQGYGYPSRLPLHLKKMLFEDLFQPLEDTCISRGVRVFLRIEDSISENTTWNGTTILQWAAQKRKGHLVGRIIADGGAALNQGPNRGCPSAFWWAARWGDIANVRTLVTVASGSLDEGALGLNMSPLGRATWEGHVDVVRLLYEKGADINVVDSKGHSALMLAARKGHVNTVRLLVDIGADINLVDHDNDKTALIMAARNGHVNVVSLLHDNGANINQVNGTNHSALMVAALFGHVAVVDMLCRSGALVNMVDVCNRSALMLAARGGHDDVVNLLRDKGAT